MRSASVPLEATRAEDHRRSRLRPLAFISAPTALLAIFFLLPMVVVMLVIALEHGVVSGQSGFTLSNFTDVLTDPLYREWR